MCCSIFNIRSGLPHALFRRILLLAVYAPQPISLKRWKKRVQLDQYGSLAALRLLSSRTSLKETTAMCSYLATERQNKQATNMETAENGGLLRLSNQAAKYPETNILTAETVFFHYFVSMPII